MIINIQVVAAMSGLCCIVILLSRIRTGRESILAKKRFWII
jgi:hypothetical protein